MENALRHWVVTLALLICFGGLVGGAAVAAAEEHAAPKEGEQKKEEPKKGDEKKDKKPDDAPKERPVSIGQYYDVPQIQANLLPEGRKAVYIVINIVLEMNKETDRPKLDAIMPIVMDAFTNYLSQVSSAYLKGSIGVYRLKEELLTRAVTVCYPIVINNVLIKEMLVK